MNKVTGKFAFITGGTQGLGAAIAREFAKNECAGIVTIGRKEKEGQEIANTITKETGCPVHFFKTDLSIVNDCRKAIAFMKEKFGRIDILVNAAGMTDRGTIVDTSEELYDKMLATNLKGPFFLMQDAIKIMIEQEIKGSIINIGSVSALTGQPFISAYCTSKGGLATLTRNTAFALLKNNIRVNQLNIGWMGSDGEKKIQKEYPGTLNLKGMCYVEFRDFKSDEVARALAFLASDESGLMTGSVVNFDQSVWAASDAMVVPEHRSYKAIMFF